VSLKFTIEIDCEPAADVLSEYFGVKLPEEYLVSIIKKSGTLIGELADGSISDTAARDWDLIDAVVRELGGKNFRGFWPMLGTPKAEATAFYEWFAEAITRVGGTFLRGE
jgi:hypothetical protein